MHFLSRGRGYTLFLTSTEAVLALQQPSENSLASALDSFSPSFPWQERTKERGIKGREPEPIEQPVLRMKLVEANPNPQVAGLEELPGKVNYFIGNDSAKWHTDIPTHIRYASIIGHDHTLYFPIPLFAATKGDRLFFDDCHSKHWDSLVPISSADLGQTRLTSTSVPKITTDEFHRGQGDDYPTILCALTPSCLEVRAMSPVDIEVVAPDGRRMSQNMTAIPGASFMEIEDGDNHVTTTVLIPFPLPGNYKINISPKPGASPTDTYTVEVTRGETTTMLAQNQLVQNIPSKGYTVPISPPPTCATNVSSQVTVARGGFRKNSTTGRYVQQVTLKNTGNTTVTGPVSLVLDGLSANAMLFNKSGNTACATPVSPYINVNVGADNALTAGESATWVLEFANPNNQNITYNTRVLAGSGTR